MDNNGLLREDAFVQYRSGRASSADKHALLHKVVYELAEEIEEDVSKCSTFWCILKRILCCFL